MLLLNIPLTPQSVTHIFKVLLPAATLTIVVCLQACTQQTCVQIVECLYTQDSQRQQMKDKRQLLPGNRCAWHCAYLFFDKGNLSRQNLKPQLYHQQVVWWKASCSKVTITSICLFVDLKACGSKLLKVRQNAESQNRSCSYCRLKRRQQWRHNKLGRNQ